MPNYTPTSKYTGIISEDETVFEGIARPQAVLALHEGDHTDPDSDPDNIFILERYFTDIANLFQKRLSIFSSDGDTSDTGQDAAKLRSLLEEMIKVKTLIVKAEN